ncbi:MAG: orotidine-5'-phosphate decarboxylase [bacterium]|nr:orotidine-5'-phosphate decarboxylase [bacterium]
MTRNFMQMLQAKWDEGKFVCVGLDSDLAKIPTSVKEAVAKWEFATDKSDVIFAFNREIIDATKDLVCAYKPNVAFYEAYGDSGLSGLRQTIYYILRVAPDVPVIYDAKRADIGNTNDGYVRSAFGVPGEPDLYCLYADAITVNPYLGREAMQPFLDCGDKGIIVLCRTSNYGAGEFQDLPVQTDWAPEGTMPLYQYVAMRVAKDWNANGNCALVVGATYPDELAQVRQIVGDMPILIPGIGAQGGDLEATVKTGKNSRNQGMIINSSRGIIFASSEPDFAEVARQETQKLHDAITLALG